MQTKYTVKKSTIPESGNGVFADEFIPKGKLIWDFKDKNIKNILIIFKNENDLMIKLNEFKKDEEKKNYLEHCFIMNGTNNEIWIAYELDDGKFFNHSLHNNVDTEKCVALRDIKKGEELFINYCEYPEPSWFTKLQLKYGVWLPTAIKL